MSSSNLGLPRYVLTFLRHMEPHKDFLKWNIGESSHKVSLTLSWNFQMDKGTFRENIMRKLNRTLHITQPSESLIPRDVRAMLDNIPRKNRKTRLTRRLSSSMAAIRRTLSSSQSSIERSTSMSLSRYGSQASHLHRTPPPPPRIARNNSFHGYAYHSTPKPHSILKSQSSAPISYPTRRLRSRSLIEACQSLDELDYTASSRSPRKLPYSTSFQQGSATYIANPNRSPYQQRAKLAYRSETSLEESLEDLVSKARKNTREQLQSIKHEWDETIRDWPNIVSGRAKKTTVKRSYTSPGLVKDIEVHEDYLQEAPNGNMKRETVNKCLDSCEKILSRYETNIP